MAKRNDHFACFVKFYKLLHRLNGFVQRKHGALSTGNNNGVKNSNVISLAALVVSMRFINAGSWI